MPGRVVGLPQDNAQTSSIRLKDGARTSDIGIVITASSKKILIVEDDTVTATAHRKRLGREGYRVETAADAEEGLSALSWFEPDAVLLDLNLPTRSGFEVLKAIRASEQFCAVGVLVFTSTLTEQTLQECMEAGADKVFEKGSLSVSLLLEGVEGVLRKRSKDLEGAQPKDAGPCH